MTRKMNRKRERERKKEREDVCGRGDVGLTIEMSKRETILCRGGQQDWTAWSATMAYDACSHGAGTVEQDSGERP